MRVYIAGPYMPRDATLHDASRVAHQNTMKAIEKFHELKKQGHEPFVPHLSHFLHIEGDEDYYWWWVEYDLTFLEHWAEGIYMMRGWERSKGSKVELEKAKELGLSIMYEDGGK